MKHRVTFKTETGEELDLTNLVKNVGAASANEHSKLALHTNVVTSNAGSDIDNAGKNRGAMSQCAHGCSSPKWCTQCQALLKPKIITPVHSDQSNIKCPAAPLPGYRCDRYDQCPICRPGAPVWDEIGTIDVPDEVLVNTYLEDYLHNMLGEKERRYAVYSIERDEARMSLHVLVVVQHHFDNEPLTHQQLSRGPHPDRVWKDEMANWKIFNLEQ